MESVPIMQNALGQNKTAIALAEALFPDGRILSAPDAMAITATVSDYFKTIPGMNLGLAGLLAWLETRFFLSHRQSFSAAPLQLRREFLEKHRLSTIAGPMLRMLATPYRAAYLLDDKTLARMGTHNGLKVPTQVETFRWQSQVSTVDELELEQTIDADVVVIGTGAGGAAAAYTLASRGLAVVVLEEGRYYDRRDFNGKLTEVIPKLYRAWGGTVALGNTAIPVPVGKSVGGTTTINSGTCMRTPNRVLAEWQKQGLRGFTPDEMAPYFEQVEDVLSVQRAEMQYVGGVGEVIETGASALGFTQTHPLMRNAKGCDGQGLCQFGCPTDAKQSTNVSYMPRALDAGAFLYTGVKAETIQWDGNKVTGLLASGVGADDVVRHIKINAGQVVVAAGTFFTPTFLKKNGIKNRWLGANLSIHPAGAVLGYYPGRDFKNTRAIPQGYGVADWADRDIMFEGGTPPFAAHGLINPLIGQDFVDFTEQYQQMAYFGFMIKDESRGHVRQSLLPDMPLITYSLNKRDFGLFLEATETLARMHLAAGAEYVHLGGYSQTPRIYNEDELKAVMSRKLKPRDFTLSAYHPLGTARIAANPGNGVCDSDHQVFGTDGLYVMDGSSVPSSLGANPQVTIMAMATKAAQKLANRVLAGYL